MKLRELLLLHVCAVLSPLSFAMGQAPEAGDPKIVRVFVALADNENQGIVPVPAKLGNGDDPANNLYWGAAYGIKTFLARSPHWRLVSTERNVRPDTVLERCVFVHTQLPLRIIADAYRGARIKEAVADFLDFAAGRIRPDSIPTADSKVRAERRTIVELAAYIGHNGLMDFNLPLDSLGGDSAGKEAIMLACMSRQFFGKYVRALRADPVLWTTGLMAPEAYTFEAATILWAQGESRSRIRDRAAEAYHQYQRCGLRAAKNLLVSGF